MNQRSGGRPSLVPRLLAGLVAVGLLLSACGSSDGVSASDDPSSAVPSESPSESVSASPEDTEGPTDTATTTEPQCEQVWVADQPMPNGYKGCYEGETFVKVQSQRCAFGAKLYTHAERFYAAQFKQINETDGLSDSEAYQKARTQCSG